MKKLCLLFAGAYVAATVSVIAGAQAHTAQQCVKDLQNYAALCKFSPTALILGFCKNKKAQEWCKDKKEHDAKFHK